MNKLDESTVESSSEGWKVYVNTGKWIIEYTQGDKTTEIWINRMSSPLGLAIFEESVQHWHDEDETPIDAEKKAEILAHVEEALKILNCPYKIV